MNTPRKKKTILMECMEVGERRPVLFIYTASLDRVHE